MFIESLLKCVQSNYYNVNIGYYNVNILNKNIGMYKHKKKVK